MAFKRNQKAVTDGKRIVVCYGRHVRLTNALYVLQKPMPVVGPSALLPVRQTRYLLLNNQEKEAHS